MTIFSSPYVYFFLYNFSGYLKDKTEGYLASFAFLGVTIAVGGLLFVPTLCLRSKDAKDVEEEEEDTT